MFFLNFKFLKFKNLLTEILNTLRVRGFLAVKLVGNIRVVFP